MELFAIERYVGDSSSTVQSSAKESQKLAEILEEAKGRKRMREISKLHTVKGAGQSNNEASLQGMKKKKKKGSKVKKGRKLKHERKEDESSGSLESIYREDEDLEESRCVLDNSAYAEIKNPVKRLRTLNGQDGCDEDTQSATKHSKVNDEMTIIGGQATKQGPISVQRILPKWLANPYFFSNDVQHSLLPTSRLEYLDREFVKKLLKQNIRNFFPVQQVIIAEILSCWEEKSPYGRGGFLPPDICVCAPTGSGKTLAYVLPIVQLLQISMIRRIEALVIVPSKDLATQVWRIFNLYVQGTHLKVGLANGLKTLQREQEQLGRKR